MVNRWKKRLQEHKIIDAFCALIGTYVGSVNNLFGPLSVKYSLNLKEWTVISDAAFLQLHSRTSELTFCALLTATILWQAHQAFNVFRSLQNEIVEMFSVRGRTKSSINFFERKFVKLWKIKIIINPKIEIEDFYWCLNQVICSLDYRNISFSTIQNIFSKVV